MSSWSFSLADNVYPELLKQIGTPPKKLFYRGNPAFLFKPCIAVVGTRRISEYGKFLTQKIIQELAGFDVCIVSGLATGIDTVAHQTALEQNLPTIAVLGSGINNIYPKHNQKLSEEIEEKGLIISEYSDLTEPKNFHFPMRNRIISGISLAVLVIEAAEKSGALLTARYALEQGREIFVTPGDIDREGTQGILQLLQKGAAYPIAAGGEIIEILRRQPHIFSNLSERQHRPTSKPVLPKSVFYDLPPDQEKLLNLLPLRRAVSLENIREKLPLPPEKLLTTLSLLEIAGLIENKNGKYLRKC